MDVAHPEHPFNLIPEICRQFFAVGWVTGTGGGMSIKHEGKVYVAPSGVQKERIQPDEIFVLDIEGNIIEAPRCNKPLKISECTPLFLSAYQLRDAGACLHTHSQNAVLVTMLFDKEFRISHVEMIKGITNPVTKKSMGFRDTLVVPIIENTDFEKDLTESLRKCIVDYPESNAVLVRRHGIYVWGDTWQRAKGMVECLDYLFELGIKMRQHGLPLVHDA